MVNYVWLALILGGTLVAGLRGQVDVVTKAALDGAQLGVKTALSLIGIISFWLGLMRLAEAAGLVEILARLVRPLTAWLFPDVPRNHPAIGAIVMNLSANMLGLGNAATPMGLVAMRELQKLNPTPDLASPAMCTFLALNTSCLTLVPSTVVGLRAIYGSQDPTSVVGTTICATACGMLSAVVADRILRRVYGHR